VSRRARRAQSHGEPGRRAEPGTAAGPGTPAEPSGPAEDGRPAGKAILLDIVILAAVFGIAVGIAELAGAANLGVSFGVGQICFALALIVVLTRD
jgi:hypothetical protein